jgi:hypothetical protein
VKGNVVGPSRRALHVPYAAPDVFRTHPRNISQGGLTTRRRGDPSGPVAAARCAKSLAP